MTTATTLADLDAVSKTYRPPTAVTALAGVTLRIGVGETVAISGPSGSGKSTLLNLLGTLERLSSGRVRLDGVDAARMTDRQLSGFRAWRVGFVFQHFHLLEHLSVLDNVATAMLYRGWGAQRRRHLAAAGLERVGLCSRNQHRPSQLSGGERQRTAIARAVSGSPALVLADEPTGNLDTVTTSAGILSLLAGLADEQTTIVLITHDPAAADAMRRQVRLRDGRIVSDSHPR